MLAFSLVRRLVDQTRILRNSAETRNVLESSLGLYGKDKTGLYLTLQSVTWFPYSVVETIFVS